jgi:hypothetical protein
MTQHQDILTEGAKAAPALTVGGLTLVGVSLADWLLAVTLVYTLAQLFFLLRDKWWRQRKDRNGRK